MAEFVSLFTDFGFKWIFGQDEHKKFLIGFLNALFEGEFVIKDLTYRDKEQIPENAVDRGVIYDIFCTTEDDKHYILEMQNKKPENFDYRSLYYMGRALDRQGHKGKAWDFTFCPVIGVFLMNFALDELGDAVRLDYSVLNDREEFYGVEKTETRHQQEPFKSRFRMVFLQLTRFQKKPDQCLTDIEKWLYVVKNMKKLNDIPWAAQDSLFAELSKVSDVAALSPKERAAYDESLRVYLDNQAVMNAAIKDAVKDAVNATQIATRKEDAEKFARRLLAKGMDTTLVSELTELSEAEVEALR